MKTTDFNELVGVARRAMERPRVDICSKIAADLLLHHVGFDPTTLTCWRNRPCNSHRLGRIFYKARQVVAETGSTLGAAPTGRRR